MTRRLVPYSYEMLKCQTDNSCTSYCLLKWSSGLYHSHSVAVSFNHSIVFVLTVLLFSFVNKFTTIHASLPRSANLLLNITNANMNMNDSQQSHEEQQQQSHRRRILREEETDDEWDDEMLLDGTALNTTSRNQNGNRP